MRGFSLQLFFSSGLMVMTDRSGACCVWNETDTTVLYTLQSLSILTGFLYGDFMTKGFISHHTFPEPSNPRGIFVYNHKKQKQKTLSNVSSLHCSCYWLHRPTCYFGVWCTYNRHIFYIYIFTCTDYTSICMYTATFPGHRVVSHTHTENERKGKNSTVFTPQISIICMLEVGEGRGTEF